MTNDTLHFDAEAVNELIEEDGNAENDQERKGITETVSEETVGREVSTEFYLTLLSQAEIERTASEPMPLGRLHQRIATRLSEYQQKVKLQVRREAVNRMW